MRIAMIGQKGIPAIYGGIERHVEELATELAKKGNDVSVYARKWYTPENINEYNGINVIHTSSIHTKHLDTITHTFTATIDAIRQKVDIIHYHGIGPTLVAWIPKLFTKNIKVVITCHSLDRYQLKWGLFAKLMLWFSEKTAYIFADKTISVAKTVQNYYLDEHKQKTVYIPNGVRINPNKDENAKLIKNWGLEKDKYILMVARLIQDKGTHYLLEAWRYLNKQYPNLIADYKLVITGGTDDVEYFNELKRIAGDNKNVIFTDWQKDEVLESLYANSLLFVHPSEREGLPISVLQAMSYGKPILASDIQGHKELIMDNNFLFHNTSIMSLAKRMLGLLKNKEILKNAGIINKQLVKQNYNWEEITKKTLQIYECEDQKCKQVCNCTA
jgi:glycosyltransferase involved in cell wall biosynthesis